jgi:hypothetical protein
LADAWALITNPPPEQLAIGALALVGLTANELSGERVRTSLEVSDDRRETQLTAAA